jgi:hypothetical protein
VHQPDAGGGAVQHADNGFRDRRVIGVARLPVGAAVHVERDVLAAPDFVGIDTLQRLHIGAGAERPSRAGQDDDADIIVAAGSLHGMTHVALHDRRPRIHAVRPVERDDRDPLADLVENMLIVFRAHARLPLAIVAIGLWKRPYHI